jgi:tetratricopeptide (TPR) repeat protein
LEETSEHDLLHFMLDLPFELARAAMADKGAELALAMAFVDPGNFLTDRAIILAEAGEREAALAQAAENLASMPTDQWVQIKSGDVYVELGQVGAAEAAYRAALELVSPAFERDEAAERLLELFTTQGREADATAFKAAEAARTERMRLEREAPLTPDRPRDTVFRLAPKVGRNDPCPCGSGKKYKKCCEE